MNSLYESFQTAEMDPEWFKVLEKEVKKNYFQELAKYLESEIKAGQTIYPENQNIFSAFKFTPFKDVKVVILGQDPYHGPGQAHGLSFSVLPGVAYPPSLKNIFKELVNDLGIQSPEKNGCLVGWARQGVLMLNSVLTVRSSEANSHQGKGWEQFTDAAIQALNESQNNLVFLLWGSYAQKKAAFVDSEKHCIIKSVHPSPLSSHRGFFGSQPFSKINTYLKLKNKTAIDWSRF